MPIQDNDLFFMESAGSGPVMAGVSFKMSALTLKNYMSSGNTYGDYKLLVNKPDYTARWVAVKNMQASVATTDYMMVERSGVSYKVTGQQIIDYFPTLPSGVAGFIDESTSSTLTLDSNTNLSDFVNGDAITMVDNTGASASYTPQTNSVSSVATVVTYDLSIQSTYFTQDPPINLINGTGGQVETTVVTDNRQDVVLTFARGSQDLPGGSCSMYLSNGSSSSYKSARMQMSSDGNGDFRQDFTITPGQYHTFNSGYPSIYQFWITVYNPLNEQIIVRDFRGGGQLINRPVNVPELQFSSGNSDLRYFQKNDGISTGHKILNVDQGNNKMTLSGGSWSAGNTVTGPAKTGTATFSSSSGTTVNIANSNGQWIDDGNRLGTEFYIRSSSFRTGLGVLRSKAIAIAQAWSSSTNYSLENFVIEDGRYWVSTAANVNDTPADGNPTWIDLGPV